MNTVDLNFITDGTVERKLDPPKILTWHWAKPIPVNRFDWSATFDGYEPGDLIGYGASESEAINDLLSE